MERVNVVYITDEEYVMPTCVSITSLIYNKAPQTYLNIYVVVFGVSDEAKKHINEIKNCNNCINVIDENNEIYDIVDKINPKTMSTHITSTALIKFNLPNVLSNEDKVIYLDGDTIIQGDLLEMFKTPVDSYYVAAVDNLVSKKKYGILAKNIGLQRKDYFNSGVMLLNLKKMREDYVTERLFYYRLTHRSRFMDQDTLNYVLQCGWKKLPYKYNLLCFRAKEMPFEELKEILQDESNDYKDLNELINNQIILHMASGVKPWKYDTPLFTRIFRRYYNLSVYSGCELDMNKERLKWLDLARIDIKNLGASNDVNVNVLEGEHYNIWQADWFSKGGNGYVMETSARRLLLELECHGTGELLIRLQGIDRKVADGTRLPLWVDYTRFAVNEEVVFWEVKSLWHDKPYVYKRQVKDGEKVKVEISWDEHGYKGKALVELISLLNVE